ncbi:glycoside hydrolase family 5 protein [Henriciella sp.]|uniref:glycoside hydrolase family 5 protein n=1 Tax=Henriciella sp. TaxID=1968823 RepID=UPI00261DD549|nr:glycoside hydrolase family 5 protein [Henriciella sp.]
MRLLSFAIALFLAACSAGEPAAHAEDVLQAQDSPIERCMNMGGGLEAPREGDWGYSVRREDMTRLAEAGFDTIRLPVKWSAHAAERRPYRIDPDFMGRIQEIAGWAEAEGLNIIIDVHHYNELMEKPSAHRERLGEIWRQIADAFEGAPQSVIFELINEPNDKMTVRKTDALNRELLAIVRERHPDRWVIIGSAGWGNLDALLKSRPPEDDRIILTFHNYDPYNFTHQGASFADNPPPTGREWGTPEERETMRLGADLAVEFAREEGHPIFLGEFGVYEHVPLNQRVKWTRAMRELAEERNIGWCYWDYASSFRAYNLEREVWIRSMRAALLDD